MLAQQPDTHQTAPLVATANLSTAVQPELAEKPGSKALRLITCGSVDDGKSTLIGRLLWDTKSVSSDHAENLATSSIAAEEGEADTHIPEFALLLDGLQAEREQGITIDVAYRYFSTKRRAFIVADTPGHEQYTRNMATGCSTADLAVVLVDARTGILEQTRRHATIATLMGIKQLVLVVNKMDLVGYRQSVFDSIRQEFRELAQSLLVENLSAIPVSALRGHNVVTDGSAKMPWYDGPSLLQTIETASVNPLPDSQLRFPVQRVSRPDESFRGYQGTLAGGTVRPGQDVTIWPGGAVAKIEQIVTFDGDLPRARKGDAVTLVLDRNVDIARGDLLAEAKSPPLTGRTFQANIVALDQSGLRPGRDYWLKSSTRRLRVRILIEDQLNLQDNSWRRADHLPVNGIGRIKLDFAEEAHFDAYADNQNTGSFILIDPQTNNTVAAGMVTRLIAGDGPSDTASMMELTLPVNLARLLLESDIAADFRDQIITNLVPVSRAPDQEDV
ncbi:MAG: sulfate adenylyltransferase subunit CysN [Rhizobiaceae bacterium]|nr:sulfate adenylyltransferase subunit CysN [Rhizobiaceae bacterium]